MKIAIVVQRYGADINGGAELHARYIAEHLARHVDVEVLTTCASDYITWRNARSPGTEVVNGIQVQRFPVTRERDPDDFGRHSTRVFSQVHSWNDELAWLDSEGPTSPALVEHIRARQEEFDFFLFFSVRYYHAYHGARAVPGKAILVPTAERDGALGLAMFGPVFRGVRALMYNSFEERALIQGVSRNTHVPGVVVGVGSEIPTQVNAMRFRQKFGVRNRFGLYIGRIDENKGCAELFAHYLRYSRMLAEGLDLVLIGTPVIPIPLHPKIRHLGFVDDQDKYDALAAAELLIMPSYFESLSMVVLEAWALGKPVLVNGRCDVLRGQCIRGNGGLYYDSFPEFVEALRAIDFSPALAAALGRNGREYFNTHYTWPIIERTYLDMFERLRQEPWTGAMERPPGWLTRRRRVLAPADEIVGQLPTGPALGDTPRAVRREPRSTPAEARPATAAPRSAATTARAHAPGGRGQSRSGRQGNVRGERHPQRRPQRRRRAGGPPSSRRSGGS